MSGGSGVLVAFALSLFLGIGGADDPEPDPLVTLNNCEEI